MVADEVKRLVDVPVESLFVHHELVRGGDDDLCLPVAAADAHIGPSHAGGRAAVDGFYHQVLFVQVLQLLAHQRRILLVRADNDVLLGQDLRETVKGLLQLGTPDTEEVDKLLRLVVAAARPQSAAPASRQDDAIMLCVNVHMY